MVDVVIESCRIRVVRHGGWSWGGNRDALVEQVTRALPELLAAHLGDLLDDPAGDVTVAEPLRLRLRAGRAALTDPDRLAAAVRRAVVPEVLGDAAVRPAPAAPERAEDRPAAPAPRAATTTPVPDDAPATTPLRLLLAWREDRRLWQRLLGFSPEALVAWLGSVLDEASAPSSDPERLDEARTVTGRFAASLAESAPAARPTAMRLYLAAEIVARFPAALSRTDLTSLIALAVPEPEALAAPRAQPAPPAPAPPDTQPPEVVPLAEPVAPPAVPVRAEAGAVPTDLTDVALSSVLPFLVLGELQRLGCLAPLSAGLAAARADAEAPALAAALALKLLEPPERGWRRTPAAARTALAFAGEPGGAALPVFNPAEPEALLSPVTAHLAAELADGHDPKLPLFVTRMGDGAAAEWLLLDADGGLPVRLTARLDALMDALEPFRSGPVLVDAAAADPALMQALADRGRRFVTDARPGRGEDWSPVAGMAGYWTNAEPPAPLIAEAARRHGTLAETAQTLWRALREERPISAAASPALERCLFVIAAAGLGMLAFRLWRERETTDPVLALDRLGDLEGRARFTEAEVEVRMALGRRYLDLRDSGALRDIPGAPWLGGRVVRFVGP